MNTPQARDILSSFRQSGIFNPQLSAEALFDICEMLIAEQDRLHDQIDRLEGALRHHLTTTTVRAPTPEPLPPLPPVVE